MKKNIFANFIGKVWGIFANFLFIPIYIKILGFSSYSVISFTLVMAGIMSVLDGGLTATLSREFSRQDKNELEKQKTYETLEILYFIITFLGILSILLFSNLIARELTVKEFSTENLSLFLKIVSFDLAFQLLFRFYLGGLIGLNKQVLGNIVQVIWGVFRSGLVIFVIYYKPSLVLFFSWQALTTILFTIVIKVILDTKTYKKISFKLIKLRFNKLSFLQIKGFAGGMLLISLISAISSQLDKVLISKMLNLETLGYYTLGVSIASILIIVVSPISTAVLPKITEIFSIGKSLEAKNIFNKFSVYISIIIFSFLGNMIFFNKLIIWVWTGNKLLVEKSSIYVPIISIAYGFMVLGTMSYQVALAKGFTKYNTILGIANVILIVPSYYICGKVWGAIGISYVFMVLQILNFILYAFLINKKFINNKFFTVVILRQLLIPFSLSLILSYFISNFTYLVDGNRILSILYFGISIFLTLLVLSLLLPREDKSIIKLFFKNNIKFN